MLLRTLKRYSTLQGIYFQRKFDGLKTWKALRNIQTLNFLDAKIKPCAAAQCCLPCQQHSRRNSGQSSQQPTVEQPLGKKTLPSKNTEPTAAVNNMYSINNPYSMDTDNKEPVTEDTDTITKSATKYWSSLFQVYRAPGPTLLTGLAGLVPFAAPPYYLYFYATSFSPLFITAQLAYGALILSFVGGIRWGFVVPFREGSTHLVKWRSIVQSVLPPIMAWAGLMIPDLTGGLLVVITGLLVALYNDLRLFGDYPKWMMGLRCLLTTVAVAALFVSVYLVEENRLKNAFGERVKSKLLDKEV